MSSSNRVYVGNLAWGVSWQDLKDHMRDAGDVQYSKILTDRDGRSKGCGIVEYSTPEGAKDAIEKLTDTELKGRKIFVREDREDGKRGGARGGGGKPESEGAAKKEAGADHKKDGAAAASEKKDGAASSSSEKKKDAEKKDAPPVPDKAESSSGAAAATTSEEGTQLFIGNLSWEATWQELKEYFKTCGDVQYSEVAKGRDGRKKGFGFIRFASAKEAKEAIEKLNGVEFMGRKLEVRLDNKSK